MKDALYGGVNAAVLTAMNADLSIDLDRMAAHCRWLLANGCNGLGVLGTTGEANSLGVQERIAVLEGLVERGIPAARMMPGTGTTNITDTVLLTRHAESVGCPGALLLPPFYYKSPSDDGLLAYFNEVIQRVGGSIAFYLYNFPQQSAVPFSVAFIDRLRSANPGKVRGVKDSSGSYENGLSYVEAFARDGFEVYAGDDSLMKPLLEKGSAGCITAAANVNCAVAGQVYAGWDTPAGEAAQAILTATRRAVTSVPLISGLKALVARNTGDARWETIRPPHLPVTDAQRASVFAAFDATGCAVAKAGKPVRSGGFLHRGGGLLLPAGLFELHAGGVDDALLGLDLLGGLAVRRGRALVVRFHQAQQLDRRIVGFFFRVRAGDGWFVVDLGWFLGCAGLFGRAVIPNLLQRFFRLLFGSAEGAGGAAKGGDAGG